MTVRTYHFWRREDFDTYAQAGCLLEHAEVHGHGYGTVYEDVARHLRVGVSVAMVLDIQGYRTVREALGEIVCGVFLKPPSLGELRRRLAAVKAEMAGAAECDHVVLNADLALTVAYVQDLLWRACRPSPNRSRNPSRRPRSPNGCHSPSTSSTGRRPRPQLKGATPINRMLAPAIWSLNGHLVALAALIHGMAAIRWRVSRKLLIVFTDWVSTPSIQPITPSHTRHVRHYDRAVPVSSRRPQESHRGV